MRALLVAAAAFAFTASPAQAAIQIGAAAPNFTAVDSNGKTHSLKDFAGKKVVLEWTNHKCPFVVKHYGPGNMQKTQKQAVADGAVWLSVISSAPGKQGYVSAAEANQLTKERNAVPTAVLLDSSGAIGKAYGAKTTPHIYVIDAKGKLAYAGAIDNKPDANPASIPGATNYAMAAVQSLKAGKAVEVASTTPYGCSVKY
jgi:peroxiredoxin